MELSADIHPISSISVSKKADKDSLALPIRDLAKALHITGGADDLAENMFTELLKQLPQQFELMQQQAVENDWEGLWNTAHRMHGAAAVCGVPALGHAVALLESKAKTGQPEEIQVYLAQAGAEIERLLNTQQQGDTPC